MSDATMAAGEHVAVARLDNLGDVLLAGPAVRAVARTARRVTLVCGPSGRRAAEMLPGVDDVVELDAPWVPLRPRPVERERMDGFVDAIAGRGVDAALVLTSFHQSPLPLALLLRMAGVGRIAATCVDYPGSLLDVRVAPDDTLHEVHRSLRLVSHAGYELDPADDGRLQIRDRDRLPDMRDVVGDAPYVVLHPGASVPARAIPDGLAEATVNALTANGWTVLVTGAGAEAAPCAATTGPGRAVDLIGRLDLHELAAVLAGAEVLVSGNSGPAHLAAAVGTPVVSVFAPVVPAAVWRPWGVPNLVLGEQEIACAGCRARACPIPGQPCVAGISAGDVVSAVGALTSSWPQPSVEAGVA